MPGNDQAMRAIDWAAARVAEAIVKHAGKRISRKARFHVMRRVRATWKRPAAPAAPSAPVPQKRPMSFLRMPFMGTQLTRGGAIATFAIGPVVWFVADLAWAALPA